MAVFHDEIEIEDFEYDEDTETYTYPCPCGDQFEITMVCLFNILHKVYVPTPSEKPDKFLVWNNLSGQYGMKRLLLCARHVHCPTVYVGAQISVLILLWIVIYLQPQKQSSLKPS